METPCRHREAEASLMGNRTECVCCSVLRAMHSLGCLPNLGPLHSSGCVFVSSALLRDLAALIYSCAFPFASSHSQPLGLALCVSELPALSIFLA